MQYVKYIKQFNQHFIVKMSDPEFNMFLKYMLEYMCSNSDTYKNVNREESNLIINFNTRRKEKVDYLLHVLKSIDTNIYYIFNDICSFLSLSIENNIDHGICYVTKEECEFPRRIVLSYEIKSDLNIKKEYIIRSDFVPFCRWFYIYYHFGYYLMSYIYKNTDKCNTNWENEMYDIYLFCENRLIELTKPLQLST